MTEQILPKTGAGRVGLIASFRRLPMVWRSLVGFWGVVLLVMGGGVGALAWLGPPEPPAEVAALRPPTKPAPVKPADGVRIPVVTAKAAIVVAAEPGLLEPSKLYPGGQLPRIGAGDRRPMRAYATAFNASDPRPRVAILLAGIGMNEADAISASANLPKSVSFAVSPYTRRLDPVLSAARAGGHELLVSIPMEPQGYPLNDPGREALLTGASQARNAQKLDWALTRFTGYVGATGALGEMHGERFAAAGDQMLPMLASLADRGLLYVDPRPSALHPLAVSPPGSAFRGVDLVLDDPGGAAELDAALARLELLARERGAAIGLAGQPSPVVVSRIAIWAAGLDARGVALAPVSVVVQMPQAPLAVARISLPQ